MNVSGRKGRLIFMRVLLSGVLFLLTLWNILVAQEQDSLAQSAPLSTSVDLGLEPEKQAFDPRKALRWAIIPGGGQVYNRRWWKVPIVLGTFTGTIAVLDFNQANYRRFARAYELRLAGEPHEFSGTTVDSDSRLLNFRDQFNRGRQSAYFYLIGIYILQGVEAYVDAHLRDFDVDEDLSLRPTFVPTGLSSAPSLALGITYRF